MPRGPFGWVWQVVALAKPGAEVRFVGKAGQVPPRRPISQGTDVPTAKMKVQQDDISGQLVALAKEGKAVCAPRGQWLCSQS